MKVFKDGKEEFDRLLTELDLVYAAYNSIERRLGGKQVERLVESIYEEMTSTLTDEAERRMQDILEKDETGGLDIPEAIQKMVKEGGL